MEFLSVYLFKRFLVSRDGYNLAFIFNSSLGQEGGACRQGLACLGLAPQWALAACLAPQWGAVRAGPATNGLGNSHSQKHRPRGRTREKRPPVSHLCPLLPLGSPQEEVFAKMRGPPVVTRLMAPGLAATARTAISSVEKQGRKKQ